MSTDPFQLDAAGVAYISKHPWKSGEQTPFHNPVDVSEWGLHTTHGIGVRDVRRMCFNCDKWDGKRAGTDDNAEKRRTPDTAERPPGPIRRAGCHGCFASFFDRVTPPKEPLAKRRELLGLYSDAIHAVQTQTAEIARRKRQVRSWRWHVDSYPLGQAPDHPRIPQAERSFDKRDQAQHNTRLIKLETRRNMLHRACLDAGFDPIQVLASGGMTLP